MPFKRIMNSDLNSPDGFRKEFNRLVGSHHFSAIKKAFQDHVFVYGTTGVGSATGRAVRTWANQALDRQIQIYDPGRRLQDSFGDKAQMMDLYCGDGASSVHLRRVDEIGFYVHQMMEFQGAYDKNVSGYDAYLNTHVRRPAGSSTASSSGLPLHKPWEFPQGRSHPRSAIYNYVERHEIVHLTGTQEMSRLIRAAIMHFGGTLVFEGANVFYKDVFLDSPNVFVSDTMLEARALFPYFKKGMSSVKFGIGQLVFHWFGKERVPSHTKFKQNWQWAATQTANYHHSSNAYVESPGERMLPMWNQFVEEADDDWREVAERTVQVWKSRLKNSPGASS